MIAGNAYQNIVDRDPRCRRVYEPQCESDVVDARLLELVVLESAPHLWAGEPELSSLRPEAIIAWGLGRSSPPAEAGLTECTGSRAAVKTIPTAATAGAL